MPGRSRRRLIAVLAATALVGTAACARSEDTAAVGEEESSVDASSLTLGEPTLLKVTLSDGPRKGTHEKRHDGTTCTVGFAGEGSWGNAASDTEDKEGLVGMDLVVKDTAAAFRGTDDFMAMIYFDDRLDPGNQYEIVPREGKGSGTVKVVRDGQRATVTIDGRTKSGVKVDATVECGSVMGG